VELDGLTGKIKFDSRGLRVDFELEIVELKKDGLQKVRSLKNVKETNYTFYMKYDNNIYMYVSTKA
jgi:hypothetical protein